MSERYPVCKSRLWTDPLFTPGRLRCPRCSTVFKPTVPWIYFKILLFVVITLGVLVTTFLVNQNSWLFLFLILITIFFWYLPKVINLEYLRSELELFTNLSHAEQLSFKLEDDKWEEKGACLQKENRFRNLMYFLLAVALIVLLVASVLSHT